MRTVSILFLIHELPEDPQSNLRLFTQAAIMANIQVAWGVIDSLELSGREVLARGSILTNSSSLTSYEPSRHLSLSDFETIWVLSLGHRSTFLDKIQLLHLLPQSKLINNCDALLHLNSKYAWHCCLNPSISHLAWPHLTQPASSAPSIVRALGYSNPCGESWKKRLQNPAR